MTRAPFSGARSRAWAGHCSPSSRRCVPRHPEPQRRIRTAPDWHPRHRGRGASGPARTPSGPSPRPRWRRRSCAPLAPASRRGRGLRQGSHPPRRCPTAARARLAPSPPGSAGASSRPLGSSCPACVRGSAPTDRSSLWSGATRPQTMSSAAFASCRESCLHRPTFDGDTPSRPAALASGATVLRWPRTLGRRTPLATADAPGTCGTLLRARTSPRTRGTCAGSHVRPAAARYGWCRHPKGPPLYLVAGGANRPPPSLLFQQPQKSVEDSSGSTSRHFRRSRLGVMVRNNSKTGA